VPNRSSVTQGGGTRIAAWSDGRTAAWSDENTVDDAASEVDTENRTVDEWTELQLKLAHAGVAGVQDLGRFVNNPKVLGSSEFDERAAMPLLIEALPCLTDRNLVGAVASHLRRPWARPAAFNALHAAFEVWAVSDAATTGWHLGDALGTAATRSELPTLLRISQDARYGVARQMIVHALPRFRKSPEVGQALLTLIDDPDVALHAMSALRQVLGAHEALPHLERLERDNVGTQLGELAAKQAKKARKSLV
jgi:hypothetical protein